MSAAVGNRIEDIGGEIVGLAASHRMNEYLEPHQDRGERINGGPNDAAARCLAQKTIQFNTGYIRTCEPWLPAADRVVCCTTCPEPCTHRHSLSWTSARVRQGAGGIRGRARLWLWLWLWLAAMAGSGSGAASADSAGACGRASPCAVWGVPLLCSALLCARGDARGLHESVLCPTPPRRGGFGGWRWRGIGVEGLLGPIGGSRPWACVIAGTLELYPARVPSKPPPEVHHQFHHHHHHLHHHHHYLTTAFTAAKHYRCRKVTPPLAHLLPHLLRHHHFYRQGCRGTQERHEGASRIRLPIVSARVWIHLGGA
ncbi:hypothetical protein DFH27DRAFT_527922 [Peziza echinospora]|nr:hypothetical protein DFH27DRAFT_527922 [Peziza echinospora]